MISPNEPWSIFVKLLLFCLDGIIWYLPVFRIISSSEHIKYSILASFGKVKIRRVVPTLLQFQPSVTANRLVLPIWFIYRFFNRSQLFCDKRIVPRPRLQYQAWKSVQTPWAKSYRNVRSEPHLPIATVCRTSRLLTQIAHDAICNSSNIPIYSSRILIGVRLVHIIKRASINDIHMLIQNVCIDLVRNIILSPVSCLRQSSRHSFFCDPCSPNHKNRILISFFPP